MREGSADTQECALNLEKDHGRHPSGLQFEESPHPKATKSHVQLLIYCQKIEKALTFPLISQ
jgi:hypothetical protein